MNRTTLGYLVMIVASGAVLWLIVHLGASLQAPPDCSGEWAVIETGKPDRRAVIEQSGVFMVLKVENETPQRLKFEENSAQWPLIKTEAGRSELKLTLPNLPRPILLQREVKHAPQ